MTEITDELRDELTSIAADFTDEAALGVLALVMVNSNNAAAKVTAASVWLEHAADVKRDARSTDD